MSERKIFEKLKLDPSTEDWVVLHSLGLKRTNIGPYGEIDLVVLVPGKGIACLEVKGGRVTRENGVWKTFNRKTGKTARYNKSPFLQAREGMFALRDELKRHFADQDPALRCPTSYAVLFPDVKAPPADTEAEPWEVFDIVALRQKISILIARNISASANKLSGKKNRESTSTETMKKIWQFLRPNFDLVVSRSTTIYRSEDQLISLTKGQYTWLDIASENERSLVTGTAGTGKTLLALEFARREVAAGRRVLLLCYNKVLAAWMKKRVSSDERFSGIVASHLHSFLSNIIKNSSYLGEFDQKSDGVDNEVKFGELFPFYSELALGESKNDYDTLIVDEAQDIILPQNMSVLDLLLNGGLSGGRWAFFGDFTRQAIYGSRQRGHGSEADNHQAAKDLIQKYAQRPVLVPLKVNCRNTHPIGEETALLSGFDALPYRFSSAEGLPVDYRYWKNKSEEADQLVRVIENLAREEIKPCDIVILAPTRYENSVLPDIEDRVDTGIIEISEAGNSGGGNIVFSTIHSFKGMESTVVVLTGLTEFKDDHSRSLLYVGMSRARSHLVVVAKDSLKKVLPDLVKKKLSAGWNE